MLAYDRYVKITDMFNKHVYVCFGIRKKKTVLNDNDDNDNNNN